MSDLSDPSAESNSQHEAPCPGIELLIESRDRDLGGFSVRRLIPVARRRAVGPWVFFDHMGPAAFPVGQGIDVRPHPHINLATVTYLFEGEILHRDSLGTRQLIQPGAVNLMVAGRGIVHSERERPETRAVPHRLHGLQLWHALPDAQEECDPAFHHYAATELPTTTVAGVEVRVMIGAAYGVESPVCTFHPTVFLEATLKAGQTLALPECAERALYVVSGSLRVGSLSVAKHSLAVLSPGAVVSVTALSDTRLALIGGAGLPTRFIDWNFVSSRRSRIEEAKADWRAGRFPRIPDDDQEFIPLP